mmetsp:Transcript_65475/g.213131  ORF Transcript_65475/g.213131 Transcript_65475/m.213131 type:complete len:413 (+) Transcript_65475:62-1300(+)
MLPLLTLQALRELGVEFLELLVEVLPQDGFGQIPARLKVELDWSGCGGLTSGVPHGRQERMLQRDLHGDAAACLELEHLGHAVHGVGLHVGELRLQAAARPRREEPHVLPGVGAIQELDLLLTGRTEDVEDLVQHVGLALRMELVVLAVLLVGRQREARVAGEERPPVFALRARQHAQQLRVDATHGPDIDGLGVVRLQQDELRSAVPPCDHMPRQMLLQPLRVGHVRNLIRTIALLGPCWGLVEVLAPEGTGQAEVSDLDGAVLVHEAVRGLQVPVVDASRVQVLQSSKEVVQHRVDVQRRQRHILPAELLEVGVREFHGYVDLVEGLHAGRRKNIQQLDHIVVLQPCHDRDLPKNALAIDKVFKETPTTLDRHELLRLEILGLTHASVRTRADELTNLVPGRQLPRVPGM